MLYLSVVSHDSAQRKEASLLDQIMNVVVPIAGFLNAAIILTQAFDLYKSKDSSGVSLKMFGFFIIFQLIFAINGYRLGDPWQMWGMIASVASTLVVIACTVYYRRSS